MKKSKCQWAQGTCTYLGHVVGRGKVQPEICKVEAVKDFRRPQTKIDVRAFLGFAGYYRKFIGDFAQKSLHLSDATKKSSPNRVTWTNQLEKEFQTLKTDLSRASVLTIPDMTSEFILQTDASERGVGAVLSQ